MADRMDLAVVRHRVLAGMGWDSHNHTDLEVDCPDTLARREGLLAQHRSVRAAGSLAEDHQALSTSLVSGCESLESREKTYVCHCVVEVGSEYGELVAGSCGWRCGVEASKMDHYCTACSLSTKMVIPCVSMDELGGDKLPTSDQ